MENCTIRVATIEDAESLLAIYAPYVTDTAITFEYDVPSVEEFKERIQRILGKYPYLVAEREDEIVGYAYASSFHQRAAYAWGVETSIYVKREERHSGIGRVLYETLEKALSCQNILNLNACIACPETEDEYLNKNSVQFHEHMGYRLVGEHHKCGFKFNRWYHVVWMEKFLGEHTENPAEVKSFEEIRGEANE
uniref:N-acetyltransferase family protein n=1 Tax=Acetatifactor sp. TaxID=1872090 RepID=UPI0040578F73